MTAVGSESGRRLGRFALLASGIAGTALDVAPAASGELPWTDGSTVFADAGASAAYQAAAVAVQASLIAAGSLEPGIARRLTGRPRLARRYLAIEGHRALAAGENLLPRPVRSLIDRDVSTRTGSPAASLAAALGRAPVPDAPPCFGVIRPGRLLAARGRHEASAPDVDPCSRRHQSESSGDEEAAEGDVGPVLPLFANSVGGRGALAWLLRRMLRAGRDPAGGGLLGAGSPATVRRAQRDGRGTIVATRAAVARETAAAATGRGTTYPEWDLNRGRYRPDWCTVHETEPRPADSAALAIPGGRALRQPLARLGMGLGRCRRQMQGDEVDIDAAVQARADALAGVPRDEAVYIDSLRRRRELAVLVLLDISGSSAEAGEGDRTVHEQQREAAAMLTVALHQLGDRVALYGFWSQGRSAIHLARVKSFDDDLDTLALRRLGGLVPGAFTRMGAAIRHGASILERRGGTSRRLLVVMSDGLAYDHGYERRYGEADARRALAEARRRGTGCMCLSVGSGADPVALEQVFGTAAHAGVARPEQLRAVIGPLSRAALRSAGRGTP
jgi:nitric oxide reductase NorD protein